MRRDEFHKFFKTPGPVVLPVIHVLDSAQALRNVAIAVGEGAPGVFLINHDFGIPRFDPIIRDVRARYPGLWLGVNFLAVTGREAFPILADLAAEGCVVDGYWADDARIDERQDAQPEADAIQAARSGWGGLYFGGTAFKKQRPVAPGLLSRAAGLAAAHMDVVTTSGQATGVEAGGEKLATFRAALDHAPLALASGITPENAASYAAADCFMVATGINHDGDFYTIDPGRLARLMRTAWQMGQ